MNSVTLKDVDYTSLLALCMKFCIDQIDAKTSVYDFENSALVHTHPFIKYDKFKKGDILSDAIAKDNLTA